MRFWLVGGIASEIIPEKTEHLYIFKSRTLQTAQACIPSPVSRNSYARGMDEGGKEQLMSDE